jgi:hypothetical protein
VQERVVRVAFVGAPERLAGCTHDAASGGVEPHRLSIRTGEHGALQDRLGELDPDVVVALGGGALLNALTGLPGLTLGYLAEPLEPGWDGFDRVIAADEALATDAEGAGVEVWRVLALPVADCFFRPARRPSGEARVVELDATLEPERLDAADVAVSRASEAVPETDHAVLTCMAAGLLVVSSPLRSLPWLEPDIDFVEADREERVAEALRALREDPSAFHRQRLGGRLKAERMRASSVWARIVQDLRRDVSAFGRTR